MADTPRRLPPKKEVALALLEGPSVFVHLDPRRPGVVVPKWFLGQPQLVLQVGLNMAIPIPDLKVDEEGVTCTLSFSRSPFWCFLPWSAIYALVGEDGRGMIWPNDVPPEVSTQMQKTPSGPAGKGRGRPKLSAVADLKSDGNVASDERPELGSTSKRKTKHDVGPRAVPQPLASSVESTDAPASEPPPSESAGETPSSPPGAGKKRRELPPYLRVIK